MVILLKKMVLFIQHEHFINGMKMTVQMVFPVKEQVTVVVEMTMMMTVTVMMIEQQARKTIV